jgi:putative membrane protein
MMMNLGIYEIIVLLLISGLLVFLAVMLVIALFGSRRPKQQHPPQSAREILDQRYAQGELTRDQYEQMRKDLEG